MKREAEGKTKMKKTDRANRIHTAYFDNAATTFPKPQRVYDFMDSFYREYGGNAGRGFNRLSLTAGELVEGTRALLQGLLHCPRKQVVFAPSATVALNMVLQGLVLSGARNVYITPFEHNAVTRTLRHFEAEGKITLRVVPVSSDMKYEAERFLYQAESSGIDLLVASHASNVVGLVAPVMDLCAVAKRFGAFTVIDMAQTAGLVNLDCGSPLVDFAVFAGHKTLYGPTGISGFVMEKGIGLPPVLFGGTGVDSAGEGMPDALPQRYEPGTLNIVGIAGLHAALEWIQAETVDAIRRKEARNRSRLLEILGAFDFVKPVGIFDGNDYTGIVSCVIDGVPGDIADAVFSERNVAVRSGLHCAPLAHKTLGTFPSGTVRFSAGYFTSEEDFETLRSALEEIGDER